MALQKNPISINFSKGLDTKVDPFQVAPGNFLSLQNSVFGTQGLMQKRNGFGALTALPDASNTYLTTFNGNLTAIGTSLSAFADSADMWVNKGSLQPVDVSTLPIIRNNLNQTYADASTSASGLVCTVFSEDNNGSPVYKYAVHSDDTGQNVIPPTLIQGTGVTTYNPRVFTLGRYFIVMFNDFVSSVNRLKYIPINIATLQAGTPIEISAQYSAASTGTFDGVVANNNLYVAWNASVPGIRITYIDSNLVQHITVLKAGNAGTNIAIAADESGSTPDIYVAALNQANNTVRAFIVDQQLGTILAPTLIPMGSDVANNITIEADNGSSDIICEFTNTYSYNAIRSDYVGFNTLSRSGTIGTFNIIARSVGLASKAFIYNSEVYFLGIYGAPISQTEYQPTYFLLNLEGQVISRFAYQNAGPYLETGLPSVSLEDNAIRIPYLLKTLIQSVNKNTNVPAGSQVVGIYSQIGVNLIKIVFGTDQLASAEIGNNLNITGGYMAMYDGQQVVEQNFFVYPENIDATFSATGGTMAAQPDGTTNISAYYYQVTYEWTDNQGNAFRSAPSIPLAVTTTGSASTGSVALNIPTLRLTYKLANPVKIVIYRWSVAQQEYYQVTSIQNPLLNDTSVDSVAFVDTLPDADILGNNLIYTTGGVLEDVAPPPSSSVTLFNNRLWLIDGEDRNLLWFSKLVIEDTPVEMTDLQTIYVAPSSGAGGGNLTNGPITSLSAMDDKLIIFKKNAIFYISGQGPDATGANNQYSEPVFITSAVGCTNQKSIVVMPNGLMFQSDKGIWLLDRSLNAKYIGAPVEKFNNLMATSAVNVPDTNQVRFTLDIGTTLMYDYYYDQWGTFTNIPAVSSTIYNNLHTYIKSSGSAFQETPGEYLDGSNPVLMSFESGWFNLAGLQGYQRAYFFYLLGVYKSPHKLQIQISYDYREGPTQTSMIVPTNYSPDYGDDTLWGGGTNWGGNSTIEQWRVFFNNQKCESFKIYLSESYDASIGAPAGAGLTLSGLNLIVGAKKGYTATLKPKKSV